MGSKQKYVGEHSRAELAGHGCVGCFIEMGKVAIFDKVSGGPLRVEVEQELNRRDTHTNIRGKHSLARRISNCKGPEMGLCLA